MPIQDVEDNAVFSNPLNNGAESAEELDRSTAVTDVLEDSAPDDTGTQSVAEDIAPTGTWPQVIHGADSQ